MKQVRDDRDSSIAQLTSLRVELTKCKEQVGKSSEDCESLRVKMSALGVCRLIFKVNYGLLLLFC